MLCNVELFQFQVAKKPTHTKPHPPKKGYWLTHVVKKVMASSGMGWCGAQTMFPGPGSCPYTGSPMFWFHFHVQIQWHKNSVSILPTNILGWLWLVQNRSHAHSLTKAWPGECGLWLDRQVTCSLIELGVEPIPGEVCELKVGERRSSEEIGDDLPFDNEGEWHWQPRHSSRHPLQCSMGSSLSVLSYSIQETNTAAKMSLKATSIL